MRSPPPPLSTASPPPVPPKLAATPTRARSPTPPSNSSDHGSAPMTNASGIPLFLPPMSPTFAPNDPLLGSTTTPGSSSSYAGIGSGFSSAAPSRHPSYISSPLNPNSPRSDSRLSFSRLLNMSDQSDESGSHSTPSVVAALGPPGATTAMSMRDSSVRGSMLLYRLASSSDPFSDDLHNGDTLPLPPPTSSRFSQARFSVASSSGASTYSSDSRFGTINEKFPTGKGAFLPYAYDPTQDQDSPPDADDILHDPDLDNGAHKGWASSSGWWNWRGVVNLVVLTTLIAALVALFTLYPIVTFFRSASRNFAIDNNIQVNATGQVPSFPNLAQLIDKDTPDGARTRKGWDGFDYELVFSDEFNEEGRTFWPGDDPYWEAVDLWYGATQDMEWYTPEQAITTNGSLRLRLDTADPTSNHGLSYKSAMVQSWNKFCFTRGYIEVNVSFPGTSSNVSGYWPGAWTMGNLGRPGYGASTDGMWPYSYTACDTGTYPNQTNPDGQTPLAALHTDWGRSKYNFALSWLPGQRASACTCPNTSPQDHPGPSFNVGRGAPEIDILEAQKNKLGDGGKVSQSAQFAPFNHDYVSRNDTGIATFYSDETKQNTYQGSALQQAVTALTTVPDAAYAGAGGEFVLMGFEYWGDPNDASNGFITWMVNGQPSYKILAGAVGPDPLVQIDQRLISREPMSLILNLGMSESFQTVDLTAMTFPGDFLIDYVRVYQRSGEKNVGCDPPDYPTADYIANHLDAYTNQNLTQWRDNGGMGGAGYPWPRNSGFNGC